MKGSGRCAIVISHDLELLERVETTLELYRPHPDGPVDLRAFGGPYSLYREAIEAAQEAAQECGRCLRCDHYGYGIFKGGRAAIW